MGQGCDLWGGKVRGRIPNHEKFNGLMPEVRESEAIS
jgi:hypothetical protein